jgi:hypothetical protein
MINKLKSLVILVLFTITLISCKPSCNDFPVNGRNIGDYVIKKDLSVHFIGVDDYSNRIDILIPSKYYSLKDNGDSTYDLDMYCTYRTN